MLLIPGANFTNLHTITFATNEIINLNTDKTHVWINWKYVYVLRLIKHNFSLSAKWN